MPDVLIRPLHQTDIPDADRIVRLAFGTFIGLPDPASFMGDAAYVLTRWRSDPGAAFVAELNGEIAGSNFATNWGSFGFFGPLTIRPDLWDQGLGKRLMEPIMDRFQQWGTKHAGLLTFAQSPKHVGLYQKFGFWPRFLTAVLSKTIQPNPHEPGWARFSELPANARESVLLACRRLTCAIYDGLDVTREIQAVEEQKLGDTLLVWNESRLAGFAVAQSGPGTEAGSGTCYIKFAAVNSSGSATSDFGRLLRCSEQFASQLGAGRLVAGVNLARHEAYRQMLGSGFRTDFQGVAMQKPNDPAYNRPGVYVIDDWR